MPSMHPLPRKRPHTPPPAHILRTHKRLYTLQGQEDVNTEFGPTFGFHFFKMFQRVYSNDPFTPSKVGLY